MYGTMLLTMLVAQVRGRDCIVLVLCAAVVLWRTFNGRFLSRWLLLLTWVFAVFVSTS
jgi:hypothetical protein